MTFSKRFDIKQALKAATEEITEDLTGDKPAGIDPNSTNELETPTDKVEVIAQEGDTVDMLEASTQQPIAEEPSPVIEPTLDNPELEKTAEVTEPGEVTEPVVVVTDATQNADSPVVDHAAPTTADDAVIVNGDVTINNDIESEEEEEEEENPEVLIGELENEVQVGAEAIALLGKLNQAIEASVESKVSIETIALFSKVTLESICSSVGISPESKAYPSLDSNIGKSISDFSSKLSASVESFKEKISVLKTPKE